MWTAQQVRVASLLFFKAFLWNFLKVQAKWSCIYCFDLVLTQWICCYYVYSYVAILVVTVAAAALLLLLLLLSGVSFLRNQLAFAPVFCCLLCKYTWLEKHIYSHTPIAMWACLRVYVYMCVSEKSGYQFLGQRNTWVTCCSSNDKQQQQQQTWTTTRITLVAFSLEHKCLYAISYIYIEYIKYMCLLRIQVKVKHFFYTSLLYFLFLLHSVKFSSCRLLVSCCTFHWPTDVQFNIFFYFFGLVHKRSS